MAGIFDNLDDVELALVDHFDVETVVDDIKERLRSDGLTTEIHNDTIIFAMLKFIWSWADENDSDGVALMRLCAEDRHALEKERAEFQSQKRIGGDE